METTKKITARDYFDAIEAVFSGNDLPENITADDVVAFCQDRKVALDKKAEKAREAAAKRKVEGDALSDALLGCLTTAPATISDIQARLGDDEVSRNKITYRLSALAKNGKAVKGEMSIPGEDGGKARKVVTYALA